LAGKRRAEQEAEDSEEEEEEDLEEEVCDDDEEEELGSSMMAAKKKSTPQKPPAAKPKATHIDNAEDVLADDLQTKLYLDQSNWMVMDRTQHIPVIGYVFVNPRSNVRFVRLILEPYGSITESMLEASISQDGMEAIVKITFEGGTGEIMNAKHTEKRYPNVSPFHHFIVSMKQAARFYSEKA
jgi:hypothetical protein